MNRKLCTTAVSPLGERKMAFTISTAAVDRDGDTIDPKGWQLANYRRSPVVLWAHDHTQPPIGKASSVWADSTGLHATVEFPPTGVYPFADMIHDMCKNGFLNATSVGFIPKESQPTKTGQAISKAELLEFSIVSVPSNPHALVLQRAVNAEKMFKWLGQNDRVDLDAIFGSSNPEIDWQAINRSLSNKVEIRGVTTGDVELVVKRMLPLYRDALRDGLRAPIRAAVERAMCRLTGRLD